MKDETNGWAVILGISSGTGASIAKAAIGKPRLHLFGMHRGNHQQEADELEAAAADAGVRSVFVKGDAGTAEGVKLGVARLAEEAGPRSVRLFAHSLASAYMGVLAAEPGGPGDRGKKAPPARPYKTVTPQRVEITFDVMAHSFVYWVQELVDRELLAEGAQIVGLTNPFTESCCLGFALIASAKAALECYTRYLAFELGPRGYRVNLVKFGLVETPAVRTSFGDAAWEHVSRRAASVGPLGRIATTDEVGRFVVRLLDEEMKWFNGATIDITGAQAQSMVDYLFRHR